MKLKKKATDASEKVVVERITKLHKEIMTMYRRTVENAIEIGRMLTQQKAKIGYGKWLPWVTKNLPFTDRTASNYMRLYKHRKKIKSAKFSDLQSAYRMVFNLNNDIRNESRNKTKASRKKIADRNARYTNPEAGNYHNQIICGDNKDVMEEMLKCGMAGKYTAIVTSPPYNANFYYGKGFDDHKPYDEYLKGLLDRFSYYERLLREGGRVIYVVGNNVKNPARETGEDYNYYLAADLAHGVKEVAPSLKLFNRIVWDKGGSGRCTTNTSYGTFRSPECPLTRSCSETILVWAKNQDVLPNIEGTEPDISGKEFLEWSWSVWTVAPYSKSQNPHPCAFPPRLVERLIKFYTWPNDLILDPYAGAHTTCEICKKFGRRYTGIELNSNYCQYGKEQVEVAKAVKPSKAKRSGLNLVHSNSSKAAGCHRKASQKGIATKSTKCA